MDYGIKIMDVSYAFDISSFTSWLLSTPEENNQTGLLKI